MAKNKKEEPFLSPTSRAINALLNGEYPGLNVPQVLQIISSENVPTEIQAREIPKPKPEVVFLVDSSLREFFTPEELENIRRNSFNK